MSRYTMSGSYRVASVSRIDKSIGLFGKRALQKRQYSAKETYNFIDPTDRSHPISRMGSPANAGMHVGCRNRMSERYVCRVSE